MNTDHRARLDQAAQAIDDDAALWFSLAAAEFAPAKHPGWADALLRECERRRAVHPVLLRPAPPMCVMRLTPLTHLVTGRRLLCRRRVHGHPVLPVGWDTLRRLSRVGTVDCLDCLDAWTEIIR